MKAKKGTRVMQSDVVTIDESQIERFFADFSPVPATASSVSVIFRDNYLIAVDKPAGMDCAPLRGSQEQTLVAEVLYLDPRLAKVKGWKKREPGLLYRLDRDVSGVVVFGLNQESFDKMLESSRRGKVRKTYLAVVENPQGERIRHCGLIRASDPMITARGKKVTFRKISFLPTQTFHEQIGKASSAKAGSYTTFVEPLLHAGEFTLAQITISMAFRHQIRSCLSQIGHPIVHDVTYGSAKIPPPGKGGIMLHCWKVQLTHPGSDALLVLVAPPVRIAALHEKFAAKLRLMS